VKNNLSFIARAAASTEHLQSGDSELWKKEGVRLPNHCESISAVFLGTRVDLQELAMKKACILASIVTHVDPQSARGIWCS
jgi:hypothetical protein